VPSPIVQSFDVTIKLFGGIVLDEARSRRGLHAFVGNRTATRWRKLGHAGLAVKRAGFLIGEPGCLVNEKPRGSNFRGHVRELELNGRNSLICFAELFALLA